MKTFVRSIVLTGALALAGSGIAAAQSSDATLEQRFKAKYGRSSPQEDARQKAERENTAFREEPAAPAQTTAPSWAEQRFKAKFGRATPAEDARLKAEQESTAFREEPARPAVPGRSWAEQLYRAKYGRWPGK